VDTEPLPPRLLLRTLERAVGVKDRNVEVRDGEDGYLANLARFTALGLLQTSVWLGNTMVSLDTPLPRLTDPLTVRDGDKVLRLSYAESRNRQASGYGYQEIDLIAGTQRSVALPQWGMSSIIARKTGNWGVASDDMKPRGSRYRAQLMEDVYDEINKGFKAQRRE
jgi:hypothetical protein